VRYETHTSIENEEREESGELRGGRRRDEKNGKDASARVWESEEGETQGTRKRRIRLFREIPVWHLEYASAL
jgi:hypothetical protein